MARFAVMEGQTGCDAFAVVDQDNGDTVESCHPTEVEALRRALELEAGDAEPDTGPPPPPPPPPPPGASLAVGDVVVPIDPNSPPPGVPWRGVLVMAGSRTQDDRVYAQIELREMPLPFALQDDAQHSGGTGAGGVVCGRIERAEIVDGVILGWGVFDASPAGGRAAELAAARFPVSVDLADIDQDVTVECRAQGEVEDPFTGEMLAGCADEIVVFPFARVAGATMTPISAFEEAWVELASSSPLDDNGWAAETAAAAVALNAQRDSERADRLTGRGRTLVASAIPARPPADWFHTPEADTPTPLTVTADGHVYGHLALWGECHIGLPGCTEPPRSPSGYAMFQTGRVPCDDGTQARAGALTFRTTHADDRLDARGAIAHYEHTGQVAADVAVTDGALGVWVSGAMRPGLDDRAVREIMGAAPSGDWRDAGDGLDLVSVLQVNTPGFMGVHRAQARAVMASGGKRVQTLQRVAYGHGADRSDARLAAVVAEVGRLRDRVETMWSQRGRSEAFDALTARANAPARFVPATAESLSRALNGRRVLTPTSHAHADCGCGGTCGQCS